MSRKLAWGVAAGATLLFALTGCSQPVQAGPAGAANPNDVCGVLAAPVTATLVQNGITATPVTGSAGSACRWQDQGSSTTVTLTTLSAPLAAKDGQELTVPGAGTVSVVAPGEVSFELGGRAWDLKVESPKPGDANTKTATDLVTTVGGAIGGLGGQAPATRAAASGQKDGAPAAGTEQKDATVTVTDTGGRTTDLRLATVHVATPDGIDLGNGQTVPLDKVTKVEFSDGGDVSNTAVKVTLTDGSTQTGKVFVDLAVDGDSDFGAFRQLVSRLKSVEFRRDTPFTATPDPQLAPWETSTITVTDTTGKVSTVKAPSLRVIADPGVTLDNGQSVLFQRISRIDATRASDDVMALDVTLANGKKVSGGIDAHVQVEGDTDGGHLAITSDQLKSIVIGRGPGGS
jgi:hypothetical protein